MIETSVDGKSWTALSPELAKTYEYTWKGEPVDARYLRLRRLDSDRKSWASVRTLHINPLTPERLGMKIESKDVESSLKAFDDNPTTWTALDGSLDFSRLTGSNDLVLLMADMMGAVTVQQFDAKGREVASMEVTTPYATVALSPKTSMIKVRGHARLFEVVQR